MPWRVARATEWRQQEQLLPDLQQLIPHVDSAVCKNPNSSRIGVNSASARIPTPADRTVRPRRRRTIDLAPGLQISSFESCIGIRTLMGFASVADCMSPTPLRHGQPLFAAANASDFFTNSASIWTMGAFTSAGAVFIEPAWNGGSGSYSLMS